MTPLSTLELAGAAILAGAGALNALLGLAGRGRTALLFAAYFACLTLTNLSTLSLIGWHEWLAPAEVRWIRTVGVSTCYLLGPLFHAYVAALRSPGRRWQAADGWRHGAPFLLALAIGLLNAASPTFAQSAAGTALVWVAYHAWTVQGLPYFVAATLHAWRDDDAATADASMDDAARRALWLRALTLTALAIWLLAGLKRLAVGAFGMESALANTCLMSLASAGMFFLAWFGLRQRALDFGDAVPAGAGGARYARSALDATARTRIADDLVRLMRERRLHADPHLDLAGLSRHSGWPPTYISQALNLHLGRNFFEFVGDFRIQAACRCLADPDERRTILAIAMACGFGSKSTFNAAFRRSTGLTPSAFRRRHAGGGESDG